MKRQEITEEIEIDWLHSDIDKLEEELRNARKLYPDAKIYFHQEWTGYEDCHDEMVITRLETVEEAEYREAEENKIIAEEEKENFKRHKAEQHKKAAAKQERLREYLILKKEFD